MSGKMSGWIPRVRVCNRRVCVCVRAGTAEREMPQCFRLTQWNMWWEDASLGLFRHLLSWRHAKNLLHPDQKDHSSDPHSTLWFDHCWEGFILQQDNEPKPTSQLWQNYLKTKEEIVRSPNHTTLWVRGSCTNSPHPPLCQSYRCGEGRSFAAALQRLPEVVSEVQHWWGEPVWMDKPAAWIGGVLVWWCSQCDN